MNEAGTPSEGRIQVGGSGVEYRIYQPGSANPVVFLHDGLGSMGSWKDLPRDLAVATGKSAVVYSREGHGWSDPLRQPPTPEFMHREALALYQFLHELELADVVLIAFGIGAIGWVNWYFFVAGRHGN